MNKITINKKALQLGTAIVWAAMIIGISLLTETEGSRALSWPLLWVVIGGFIIQILLFEFLSKNNSEKQN